MTLKASDLPEGGSSRLVLVDGTLFEVVRIRFPMDSRKSTYGARVVPDVGELHPGAGWWYRFTWRLMLADLKLMAKTENEA